MLGFLADALALSVSYWVWLPWCIPQVHQMPMAVALRMQLSCWQLDKHIYGCR